MKAEVAGDAADEDDDDEALKAEYFHGVAHGSGEESFSDAVGEDEVGVVGGGG